MEFSVEYSITKIFDSYSPSLHYTTLDVQFWGAVPDMMLVV